MLGPTLDIWSQVLDRPVDPDDDFFGLGGASIEAVAIVNRLRERGADAVSVATIFQCLTPRRLAAWCVAHDPKAILRSAPPPPLTEAVVARARVALRRRVAGPASGQPTDGPRAGRMIFVLSPPRSGSTLLRVMLAGHPRLFSPPELYLLGHETLAARRDALAGPRAPLTRGLIRACMALLGCDRAAAEARLDALADEGMTTIDAYRWLQAQAGERLLVDKTPGYALAPEVLARAVEGFDRPFFIHLTRHPVASIVSFTRVRVDLALGDDDDLPVDPRTRGELWWRIGHENIGALLDTVPDGQVHRVRYEDLVVDPEGCMRALCARLDLAFDPQMLRPYADPAARMTDGPDGQGSMLGDRNFGDHQRIDPGLADRWRDHADGVSLSESTQTLAEALGYPDEEQEVWTF